MRISPAIFVGFVLFLIVDLLIAQTHLAPQNGSDGVPGSVTNSFIIKWAEDSSAVDYEYVMSNNRLCFETCPGDTRQQKTGGDTSAIEYDLIADRWYYWITRIIFENGEVSDWSPISNFFTQTPKSLEKIATIAPNPIRNNILQLNIDWAVDINAHHLDVQLLNLNGQFIGESIQIEKQLDRFQYVSVPMFSVPAGTYLLQVTVGDQQNEAAKQYILKMLVS